MSRHRDQVASVLARAVQGVLSRGLNDPRVRGLASVTRVDVSPDFANAVILVSVMPEEHASRTVHGLRHAAPHIRSEVGKRVRMRRVPHLTFKLDESLKRESRILAAIDSALRSDEERRHGRDDVPPREDSES